MNKGVLFKIYQDETPSPHLSQSSFYANCKIYFGPYRRDRSLPFVKISKYSSHSVCNTCVQLNNLRRQSRNEEEWRRATDLKNQHRKVIGEARRAVQDQKQSALTCPSDHLFLQVVLAVNLKKFNILKFIFYVFKGTLTSLRLYFTN